MPKINFVTECWAETMMVRILFLGGAQTTSTRFYAHANGISAVPNMLTSSADRSFVNIGFIDDDKRNVPAYFDEFDILDEARTVTFKKHPSENQYLIVVSPAIEKFLLEELREIRKQPSVYGLPDDFKAFQKYLKSEKLEKSKAFEDLVTDLREKHAAGIAFIVEKIQALR